MKRPVHRIKETYEELPQYALVTPINPDYLDKTLKEEYEMFLGGDRYCLCSTGKGLKLIPYSILELVNY